MVPTAYNNAIQIMQTRDHVVIWYELLTMRIIPLDGRPHLNNNIRHWEGDARGRWEGDTLVVDTTNFREQRGRVRQYGSFDGGSSEMHIVERFTRVNADAIKYEGTVMDPKVFSSAIHARACVGARRRLSPFRVCLSRGQSLDGCEAKRSSCER